MRRKEGIKPVDPYDESIRRELCSEKLTVLVSTSIVMTVDCLLFDGVRTLSHRCSVVLLRLCSH